MKKGLVCASCKEKKDEKSFSSKEKKKLNKRVCTPCSGGIKKDLEKRNKKEVLDEIHKHSSFIETNPPKITNKEEGKRREKERKKLTPSFTQFVLKRDKFICYYCKEEGDTVDHLLPISRNGSTTEGNCVCACFFCNNIKGSMGVEDFLALKNTFSNAHWSTLKRKYLKKSKDI